jgi:AbrB family looped-hinge helix DNA binding protein
MLEEPEITTMSEKGQVVIPQELRKHLGIVPKTKFVVFGKGDVIIMKRLQLPDVKTDWNKIFEMVDKKGLKISTKNINDEIKSYRKEKHKTAR